MFRRMKILHTADSHLGYSAYNPLDENGINARESDLYDAFDWMVDLAVKEKIDAVIHAGDLFHNIRPSNRALGFAFQSLRKLREKNIPFIVIAGNHETPRMRRTGSIFRVLENDQNIRPIYGLGTGRVELGDCLVQGIGHIPNGDSFAEAIGSLEPDGRFQYNIAMLHVGIGGISVFATGDFNEHVMPAGKIPHDFDYVALGHYHEHTKIRDGVYYSGSLEKLSFSEKDHEKGVRVVDLARGTSDFVPYQARNMLALGPLDAKGLDSSAIENWIRECAQKVPDGAVAKVSVENIDKGEKNNLDIRGLRTLFSHALHLDLRLSSLGLSDAGSTSEFRGMADEFSRYVEKSGIQNKTVIKKGKGYLEGVL